MFRGEKNTLLSIEHTLSRKQGMFLKIMLLKNIYFKKKYSMIHQHHQIFQFKLLIFLAALLFAGDLSPQQINPPSNPVHWFLFCYTDWLHILLHYICESDLPGLSPGLLPGCPTSTFYYSLSLLCSCPFNITLQKREILGKSYSTMVPFIIQTSSLYSL